MQLKVADLAKYTLKTEWSPRVAPIIEAAPVELNAALVPNMVRKKNHQAELKIAMEVPFVNTLVPLAGKKDMPLMFADHRAEKINLLNIMCPGNPAVTVLGPCALMAVQ